MIWRTRNGRWLDCYGQWHSWFAWYPVSLENPDGRPRLQAWLCRVARIGVIVRGHRFWLYALPTDVGLNYAPPPAKLKRIASRGEHLRVVQIRGKS